jgi:peptidoglycan/xylan/chitin deacetylase (PgdA/CDA1 family)
MKPTRAGAWAVKRVLFHSGLLGLARLSRARVRGLVLRYHALTEDGRDVDYATPDICLPVAAFRLQMAFVKRAYSVVSLDAMVDALASGGTLPPRALAITFDDGYADNHRLGLPVLTGLRLPATVYVSTGCLDGGPPLWMSAVRTLVLHAPGASLVIPGVASITLGTSGQRGAAVRAATRALVPLPPAERAEKIAAAAGAAGVDVDGRLAAVMLTWAQVRELAAAGWTIGAHTVTHLNVALADPAAAERELADSRDAVAACIGGAPVHFAYPNAGGQHRYFGPEVTEILRRLDYRSATTSRPGPIRPGVDPFALPRIGVSPRLAPVIELAAALERQRLAA